MAAKSNKRPRTKTARSGKKKGTVKKNQENTYIREEVLILCSLAACILLMISNFGLGGMAGKMVSSVMFGIFGWMAYAVPIFLFGAVAFLSSNRGNAHAYIKVAAACFLLVLLCTFFELVTNPYSAGVELASYYYQASERHNAGGLLGGFLISVLCPWIGEVGAYVVVVILAIVCVVLITERSLLKPLGKGSRKVYEGARKYHESSAARAATRREARDKERLARADGRYGSGDLEEATSNGKKRHRKVSGVSFNTTLVESQGDMPPQGGVKSPELKELKAEAEPFMEPDFRNEKQNHGAIRDGFDMASSQGDFGMVSNQNGFGMESGRSNLEGDTYEAGMGQDLQEAGVGRESYQDEAKPEKKKRRTKQEEHAAFVEAEAAQVGLSIQMQEEGRLPVYEAPPLDLLKRGPKANKNFDAQLRATALKLEQTLSNFGVGVHVTNASCGPSVTRYELQPEQGVKVSRIVGLADDIKLNLAVSDLRIEAPIPGKAAVGIEVPNAENTAVMLRDLLESDQFQNSKSNLTFAVGKDIGGKVVVSDIAKMPHLLVAGSTGSGKSVCINTIIMSLIYKADPEDVKLIMVDPKVVELNVYNGIPHLLIPVVTDPRKAAGALNWAVAEMMKRYQQFAEYNVRDLKGFNEKIAQLPDDGERPQKMAQIVIIVDELADLMMVAPKDVEGAICRLAQLARAAGLHLILATQRPSVNVITGLIKANMPSRIAFAVSSGVDSRTIIDMNGAEKLLGKGDMLFYPTGFPKPVRVQGSFVSDKEVQSVVEYLIDNHGRASYSDELEEQMSGEIPAEGVAVAEGGADGDKDSRDQYFADAGRLIIDKEKASIGMLQRMFKIGFNRAARVMDQLAEAGVVGPEEGTKPRKVLMSKEDFEQYLMENA
ncbi:MAG: DNA translocase FtsK [Ruminococcus sp.]|nr:DNA translocase FtsK [Ruminococcus sp.]